MKQFVDAGQRVDFAEALLDLLPDDRPVVRGDAFLGPRPVVQHRAQLLLLLGRELGGGAFGAFGLQQVDAAQAIAADPTVDELPRATDGGGDLLPMQFGLLAQSLAGDENHAVAIPLLGIDGGGDQITQSLSISRIFPMNIHASLLEEAQHANSFPIALPNRRRTAREC